MGPDLHRRTLARRAAARQRAESGRTGFTLVELLVVMIVLTVATAMFSGTLVSTARQSRMKHELAVASEAGRRALEWLRSQDFRERFARYNADPNDDPGGPGTAPGEHFDVPGLEARAGDADGHVGRILFPTVGTALREDLVDPELGLPRDLDGDEIVDGADHSGDYIVLPVEVRIEWEGRAGELSFELHSQFADL